MKVEDAQFVDGILTIPAREIESPRISLNHIKAALKARGLFERLHKTIT